MYECVYVSALFITKNPPLQHLIACICLSVWHVQAAAAETAAVVVARSVCCALNWVYVYRCDLRGWCSMFGCHSWPCCATGVRCAIRRRYDRGWRGTPLCFSVPNLWRSLLYLLLSVRSWWLVSRLCSFVCEATFRFHWLLAAACCCCCVMKVLVFVLLLKNCFPLTADDAKNTQAACAFLAGNECFSSNWLPMTSGGRAVTKGGPGWGWKFVTGSRTVCTKT